MQNYSVLTIKGSNDRLQPFRDEAGIADLPVYFYDTEAVLQLPKVKAWIKMVQEAGFVIEEFTSRAIVGNPNNPVMINAIVKFTGVPFAVEASIQGTSVSIAIRLISATTGKPYLLFVEQDRPVVGLRGKEFVAGRQDQNGTTVTNQAVNELMTEAHLDQAVTMTAEEKEKYKTKEGNVDVAAYLADKIVRLGGIWSTMGAVFEFVMVGEVTLTVSDETIEKMSGKLTGDKHEKGMVLHCVPEDEIFDHLTGDPRAYYWYGVTHCGLPQYHPAFDPTL
jgi:hypothetical protein